MQNNDFKDYIKTSDFHITMNRDIVFHIIDCQPNSPIYEEVIEEYNKLESKVYSLAKPVAIIKFGKSKGITGYDISAETSVVYTLMTIGDSVSKLSSQLFEKGDYLAGMLVNAMADEYLFQLDGVVQEIIQKECKQRRLGVKQRLEAPNNISMEAQKIILDETEAVKELNMDVTEGYMFTTVKTTAYILILTEDEMCFNLQHNCKKCEAKNCKMRKQSTVTIKVLRGKEQFLIECEGNESILDAMVRQNQYISAVCGGKGTCGKCRVQITEGKLDITTQDKAIFTKAELEMGYRLSCRAYPKEDCTIRLSVGDESDFEVVSEYHENRVNKEDQKEDSYVIGIDIGTTTIAVNLLGTTSGRILKTFTTINKQRAYGADVISRMQASNDGKKELLQESIRKDLIKGIRTVIEEMNIPINLVTKIAIAGNTTMGHLLMGYSCESLGIFPFTPVNIDTIETSFQTMFASDYLDIPVVLLPGISTYVGGDIVAGLLVCGFDEAEKPCMLVDLGTNGEMAIGNREKILVTSTAAGPAFEGGNISCGVGSIAGAICNVSMEKNQLEYHTIGDKTPLGICGTGVIEITSELLKEELIDETGLFEEPYFESGYEITKDENDNRIVFTQKDVREIQLAKAAVRAGIETLLNRFGLSYDMVDTVYLAGGFGYKVNIEKAISIGLLPKEFNGKIKAIGNSALAGAIKYLKDEKASERIDKLLAISEEISLSNDKDFNELYVEHMFFD